MNNAGSIDVRAAASAAREASRTLATLPTDAKNALLRDLATAIRAHAPLVRAANEADLNAARESGLPDAKLQRLALSDAAIEQLARGIEQVASLPDPVGQVTEERTVSSGLLVRRVRMPLGVIAMIYEARPGVTLDAFALCFKSGNAVLLKGGRESARTNAALAALAIDLLAHHQLPAAVLTDLTPISREQVAHLLTLNELIDLVIPRGGESLIRAVVETSRIPTIQHYKGVCHIYVDRDADATDHWAKPIRVCVTAKTSAPATCNAAECVLVDQAIADAFVPALVRAMHAASVQVRCDAMSERIARAAGLDVVAANDADFGFEFLDRILALKVVAGVDDALAHIARHTSNHTEAILTQNRATADRFVAGVQSSCVLVNASTRFNDGFQLGLGAEIGISTSRLHAYGPMGLEELTTRRFVVVGDHQTR
jgi:glutamate-5-semialdehyde dehydrogenase